MVHVTQNVKHVPLECKRKDVYMSMKLELCLKIESLNMIFVYIKSYLRGQS